MQGDAEFQTCQQPQTKGLEDTDLDVALGMHGAQIFQTTYVPAFVHDRLDLPCTPEHAESTAALLRRALR
ncbi:hypothetical protein CORC01_09521 [Colletotrichum orchidophilum]|uniref:Uncharacterized protein n=1 Tax=Colletotrichum orchidophilum TaxID=1209926 RepID=A0A1G4B163_9PEZI|nr:uncharacterized protein CORC01_09521 [Colletotrichum orchidophilum]OHE95134.1 hypothetical protein CORC01_09521 [Colletotrichum orchidophilum]